MPASPRRATPRSIAPRRGAFRLAALPPALLRRIAPPACMPPIAAPPRPVSAPSRGGGASSFAPDRVRALDRPSERGRAAEGRHPKRHRERRITERIAVAPRRIAGSPERVILRPAAASGNRGC
jgi:hypothetical protein